MKQTNPESCHETLNETRFEPTVPSWQTRSAPSHDPIASSPWDGQSLHDFDCKLRSPDCRFACCFMIRPIKSGRRWALRWVVSQSFHAMWRYPSTLTYVNGHYGAGHQTGQTAFRHAVRLAKFDASQDAGRVSPNRLPGLDWSLQPHRHQ
jgi:hypothetical protein